jgi:hypothetical protein
VTATPLTFAPEISAASKFTANADIHQHGSAAIFHLFLLE